MKAVVGVLVQDGLVLTIARPDMDNKLALIGGGVEEGESVRKALKREVKEETGLDTSDNTEDFVFLYVSLGREFEVYSYYIPHFTGTPKSSEEGEILWSTFSKLINPETGAFPEYNANVFNSLKKSFPNLLKE